MGGAVENVLHGTVVEDLFIAAVIDDGRRPNADLGHGTHEVVYFDDVTDLIGALKQQE